MRTHQTASFLLVHMVVSQQMQHRMHGQEAAFPAHTVAVFLRLRAGTLHADDHVAQKQPAGLRVEVRRLRLSLAVVKRQRGEA